MTTAGAAVDLALARRNEPLPSSLEGSSAAGFEPQHSKRRDRVAVAPRTPNRRWRQTKKATTVATAIARRGRTEPRTAPRAAEPEDEAAFPAGGAGVGVGVSLGLCVWVRLFRVGVAVSLGLRAGVTVKGLAVRVGATEGETVEEANTLAVADSEAEPLEEHVPLPEPVAVAGTEALIERVPDRDADIEGVKLGDEARVAVLDAVALTEHVGESDRLGVFNAVDGAGVAELVEEGENDDDVEGGN